ncbi:hypothetical protein [Bradyrhizobium sp. URHA0013]|uniref:hypothetical protein n=1 Tax=Bradyrhizobium sp. URHA0013 TaxID=1380352 RepID=UPI000483E5BD|nr:hypothetical protein [Bradyrhizobium sp. URHA0013]
MTNRYVSATLRAELEKKVKSARLTAEEGARDAIHRLGAADAKAPTYLSDSEKHLRRRLRAHARALGDTFDRATDTQETKGLIEAAAYAHWHRMLFARFLAERGLLRHPEHNVPVSLEDCRELAEAEGGTDAWAVAERYSAAMLPAVFRTDDPALALDLDPVHSQKLNRLVKSLDSEIFQAEDSLGWSYQYWRAAEREAINESGVKIGADELPAVTQLFTEPYMVKFLLHNTLGAWWAGKILAADRTLASTAEHEDALRAACALPGYSFDMLRFVREGDESTWRPAAGVFADWPKEAKAITMLDPCCGSGHFLTEALIIIARFRQMEESLTPAAAVAAALRDNLYGLEIDGRCVQIAAFAVALSAWRLGGWQMLPLPHIAWVGSPPPLPKQEFLALAEGDLELEYALSALHDLFSQAPILGSLLQPTGGDLFEAEKLREVERLLEPLFLRARRAEPERIEGVIAARGMADAAAMLHKRFSLQATNVPFLGSSEQCETLSNHCSDRFSWAKTDLATTMLARMYSFAADGGAVASVSKQEWLFLESHRRFRENVLQEYTFCSVVNLGEEAWQAFGMRGPLATLSIFERRRSTEKSRYLAIDATTDPTIEGKIEHLRLGEVELISQNQQRNNPSALISSHDVDYSSTLSKFAMSAQGLVTRDSARFIRSFWELFPISSDWKRYLSSPNSTAPFSGRSFCVHWQEGRGGLHREGLAHNFPSPRITSRRGVAISQVRTFRATYYDGEVFNDGCVPIVPINPDHEAAICAFVESEEFSTSVRKVTKAVRVTNDYFLKVPFDLMRWTQKARDQFGPSGIPVPYSDDPTQWLFHGHPSKTDIGYALHVALARLCGYRWPAESDPSIRLSEDARRWIAQTATLRGGDNDGLLALPAVAGEKPLADRLRTYLGSAFANWSDDLERQLVFEADQKLDKKVGRDGSLERWLRDRAFRQHCALFGQRPFLWHIWDGMKDGFSVFVHYHRFDQAALRRLTYTLLGDWLARAKAESNVLRYEKGRELQQALESILEGENPHDIFVRWKPLDEQPIGWTPDIDDGTRQNIRPFVTAGVLTHDLAKSLKDKDKGSDVSSAAWHSVFGGERRNNHHTTLAEKLTARAGGKKRAEAL